MEYGNYFYAFNPSVNADKENYLRSMRLIGTAYDVLNERNVSVKAKGYTFMKDAICIITDLKRMDICLSKEVYPLIAEKYETDSINTIEHSIRNAIRSAYRRSVKLCGKNDPKDMPAEFKNKAFLLSAAQEVSRRLLKEICD